MTVGATGTEATTIVTGLKAFQPKELYELGDTPCIMQDGIVVSCSIGFWDGFHRWQNLRPFIPVPEPDLMQ